MTEAELTDQERKVVEGYRSLVAVGGPDDVWVVDRAEIARTRAAALLEAWRVVHHMGCETEACGHKKCIAYEDAAKAIWALKEKA